jgi:hypothetical protein
MLIYLIDKISQTAPKRRRFGKFCYVQNDVALFVSSLKKKKEKKGKRIFFFSSPLHFPVLRPLTLHLTVSLPLSYVAITGIKVFLLS